MTGQAISRHGVIVITLLGITSPLSGQTPRGVTVNEARTTEAWKALESKRYQQAIAAAEAVIDEFQREAGEKQAELVNAHAKLPIGRVSDAKIKEEIFANGLLNDVATCYFIKGEAFQALKQPGEAKRAYEAACKLTYARTWDPAGWFWDPSAKSCDRAARIK